ncbi:hypothetical protein SELMODRAFT_416079 [Selaginella moellendorffii]|uniref:Dof-type domain-containing protein n=1 Tax=Selaginella moellendorffii TaxID=88036 RepID=D8RY07_SELML|nr:hypothetical protein SELMODRAFT_416079 [Selaginella moellendorffii]
MIPQILPQVKCIWVVLVGGPIHHLQCRVYNASGRGRYQSGSSSRSSSCEDTKLSWQSDAGIHCNFARIITINTDFWRIHTSIVVVWIIYSNTIIRFDWIKHARPNFELVPSYWIKLSSTWHWNLWHELLGWRRRLTYEWIPRLFSSLIKRKMRGVLVKDIHRLKDFMAFLRQQHLLCPHSCDPSALTKFDYFENHMLIQARYKCTVCKQHFTLGGTTRAKRAKKEDGGRPRKKPKKEQQQQKSRGQCLPCAIEEVQKLKMDLEDKGPSVEDEENFLRDFKVDDGDDLDLLLGLEEFIDPQSQGTRSDLGEEQNDFVMELEQQMEEEFPVDEENNFVMELEREIEEVSAMVKE